MELWLHAFAVPGRVSTLARQAEAWGFTGMVLADSQNLTADIWVELALAGAATSRLRLGPGVTNPVTRHPAVTASAALTLQVETGGRAELGFAQGDSALSQIGARRLSVDEFERALELVQGYLRGEEMPLNGISSALRWLTGVAVPKVPVHVAATGPRTIAAAARHADGVDLTVGAEPERLHWGVETARSAGPAQLTLGAYVNVAVDPDHVRARELVRGSVATLARFAAETRSAPELPATTREAVDRLHQDYQPDRHGQAAAGYAQEIDDEFIDRFAVCGPAEEVRERLARLGREHGLKRLIVVPGSLDADPEAMARSNQSFAEEVLPGLGQ